MKFQTAKLISNIEISKGIYNMVLEGEFSGAPGQFYMLRAWEEEPVLSRPISIEDIEGNSITFLYQTVGKGTKIMAKLKAGEEIKIQGPLGNTFPINEFKNKKVGIITGGIGIAPMRLLVKKLESSTTEIHCGFRDESYLTEDFKPYIDNIYISTESGNEGNKGYVTDRFNPSIYDVVFCCGPEIMMNKVIKICNEKNIPLYVSMEKHMACGIGACLVCTCKTKDGNKRTCKDGPVFLGSDVILDA